MRVQVVGRRVDVGEALSARITEELSAAVEKFFASRPADGVVAVGRDGPYFSVDCTLHLDSGIVLQAEGRDADPHLAFQDALARIEKRVRRYKRRLKNHHNGHRSALSAEPATAYVLAAPESDDNDHQDGIDTLAAEDPAADAAPLVIAETRVAVTTMPVAMAVLQLGLAEAPALMFRNAAHGRLNLVYRRADGNIGWVDPEPAG